MPIFQYDHKNSSIEIAAYQITTAKQNTVFCFKGIYLTHNHFVQLFKKKWIIIVYASVV
jgi:hypothetical protein